MDMRPELAFHIAKIAAMWTLIENQQGVALALMLKSEGALAMFMALSSSAARNAALRAAAEEYLSPDNYSKFEQQMRDTTGPQRSRNDVVHSVWAASDEHPDTLLRTPAKDHMRWFAARVTAPMAYFGPSGGASEAVAQHLKKMTKYDPRYWSWCKPDFIAVESRIEALSRSWGEALNLIVLADPQQSPGPSQ